MAANLTRPLIMLAALVMMPPGWCQYADPTRPPATAEGAESQGAGAEPVLESVLIPHQGKPVAWISGQRVELGQHFGDARLVRLTEGEAILRGPEGEVRLQLTPAVRKQPARDNKDKIRGVRQ